MRRERRSFLLLAGGFAVSMGVAWPASAGERLVITGSSTIAPLVTEMAKRYEKIHPGVRIDVQTGGSHRGLNDARRGLAEIGMVSRALKEDEHDVTSFVLAYDGVTMIVHQDSQIEELTKEQIVGIYTGRIQNWSQVGGPDKDIVVINKAEGRSTLESFVEYFGIKTKDIKADVVVGDNEQGIKAIAGSPYSIGYVSIGNGEYDVGKGVPIKLLPLEGIPANRQTVAAQQFPIVRPLNLVVANNKEPSARVADFIAFATSDDVRDIVESFYYVSPQPGQSEHGS
ncbi:MAG: phosphate transporter substrate-binding protein PhoT family [Rhodospirillales bacterium]|nr:phosphate transporter substrate-binding protein PhoT family [Rhodospirillales bacterium]